MSGQRAPRRAGPDADRGPLRALLRRLRSPSGTPNGSADAGATDRDAGGMERFRARAEAEALAARLPQLLADAERIASSMAGGVHGRLRAGVGDSFWQYRPLSPGESAARIDWRQSARGDRLFVRETEWEAAQTVCLWRDRSPSMGWRSDPALPSKRGRAELVLLALSIGLLRGGEHLFLLDDAGMRVRFDARGAAARLANHMLREPEQTAPSLPERHDLPRHCRVVLFGDFLSPLAEIRALLASLIGLPVSPVLVQLLDPAELSLPFNGRTRFEGLEGEAPLLVDQAADIRKGYAASINAHQEGLAALCVAGRVPLLRHTTDQAPETLLLGLHDAIAPKRGGARGRGQGGGQGAAHGAALARPR